MWAIIKKEVKNYFYSPIGYVFIGAFMLLSSIFFYLFVLSYGSVEFSGLFYSTSELLTFTVALLTMGMFAGERKNGTEVLLFTSSKSITSIVIGKFLAALVVILITEVFSMIYYVILCSFNGGITQVAETITVLIGFILLAGAYISFGGFMSSLTENQIIAGITTVILLLATWFLPNLSSGFAMLSPINFFQKYPQGIISITDTVGLVSITALFTVLTIIILQRKKNLK